MPQTVVGLFDTPADAQRVKQTLVSEGLPSSSVRVLSNESDGFAEGAVAQATDSSGNSVVASIKNFFHSFTSGDDAEQEYYTRGVSSGGALLAVSTPDSQVESVISLLEANGAREVTEEGTASGNQTYATADTSSKATGDTAIPIVEEQLQVGKRQVQRGGVRVYSHVVETPVEEQVRLREEHVHVQRTPVDRPASAADFGGFKEGTIELTETAEEVVVAKQARVVEEVRIGKEVTERTETIKDKVRHTEVEVDNVPGESTRNTKTAGQL